MTDLPPAPCGSHAVYAADPLRPNNHGQMPTPESAAKGLLYSPAVRKEFLRLAAWLEPAWLDELAAEVEAARAHAGGVLERCADGTFGRLYYGFPAGEVLPELPLPGVPSGRKRGRPRKHPEP